jgi:transposase
VHLVSKQIKGREYFYLVAKERRGSRVVTSRTVYVGDRQKLAELAQQGLVAQLPTSFDAQPVGALLALAKLATELGIEELIDKVCSRRRNATPIGRRVVLAAIAHVVAPRSENGLSQLRSLYEHSVLPELLPVSAASLDHRRMHEALMTITESEIDQVQANIVARLIEREEIGTESLAFDCTNFDSYAGAKTPSRLLRRGHSKSGRPLRVLGMGMLASADDGMPLWTFVYPGNENDVKSFARFLRALDRRREMLNVSAGTTVAADGGNISRAVLQRLERRRYHYVVRLPSRHLTDLQRARTSDLPLLEGPLAGKVRAQKYVCTVYKKQRTVVDVYSRRMHQRQLPGLLRDRAKARADLLQLQSLLERQRQGLRRAKPITIRKLRARVAKALSREHMRTLFRTTITKAPDAPTLAFEEPEQAWVDLQERVLGRTLLVTNRDDWSEAQIVLASRVQSNNERAFRDIKSPDGVSMLPLRQRRDRALRLRALIVILGLMLAKVLQRRIRKAGVRAPSLASVLKPLKLVQRAHVQFPPTASPALKALAADTWVPSERTNRQRELLHALGLEGASELGTTLADKLAGKKRGRPRSDAQQPGNSR